MYNEIFLWVSSAQSPFPSSKVRRPGILVSYVSFQSSFMYIQINTSTYFHFFYFFFFFSVTPGSFVLFLCPSSKTHYIALAGWNGFLLLTIEGPLIRHTYVGLSPCSNFTRGLCWNLTQNGGKPGSNLLLVNSFIL